MSIRAIGNKIVVKEIVNNSTQDGLYVPENVVSNKQKRATVLSVGEGFILSNGNTFPSRVKVGEKVCFNVAGAIAVDSLGTYVITENDVLFVEE